MGKIHVKLRLQEKGLGLKEGLCHDYEGHVLWT